MRFLFAIAAGALFVTPAFADDRGRGTGPRGLTKVAPQGQLVEVGHAQQGRRDFTGDVRSRRGERHSGHHNRGPGHGFGHDGRGYREGYRDGRRDGRRRGYRQGHHHGHGYGFGPGRHPGTGHVVRRPAPRIFYHSYPNARWAVGAAYPYHRHHARYRIVNYNYYGLPAPRHGHYWVRHGGDALLVGLATGLIVGVALDACY